MPVNVQDANGASDNFNRENSSQGISYSLPQSEESVIFDSGQQPENSADIVGEAVQEAVDAVIN